MEHRSKSVKYKVITGYLLLLAFAVASVWFVFKEISKTTSSTFTNEDNTKVIRISNAIANLYTSEALGRTAILTGSQEDYKQYSRLIDSITVEIDSIKTHVEPAQVSKFDSIQVLIAQKEKSVADIIQYHKDYNQKNLYKKTVSKIHRVKDSLVNLAEPLKPETRFEWSEIVNAAVPTEQLDSIRKFASNDSLTQAFDKVVTNMLNRESKLRYNLYLKEQQLLEENRVLSDQIRIILSSVENEILQNSYAKIKGSQKTMASTINKLTWTGGIALLVVIIFAWIIISDLTKQQKYRQKLEELNIENKDLLRSKTMLMATVTHDLQTPLGSIIGFSDLMENSGVNPKQKQYLSNIKESADYILKLVNDLMDFSKLENNRITIEEVNFNIKTLIENTCKTLEHSAENKGIELNCDIDSSLDHNFISDPYRIKQVLTNLISNAVKFTSEGSVDITATIKNNTIFIAVADTGIGIAKDRQDDVFKEFTQANSGIEKKFGGTGLGLTISKRILELLGGQIYLESEEGKGSVFTLHIPCKYGENNSSSEIIKETHPTLSGKKILIVDDDNTQLSLLYELLSNKGAVIHTEINSSHVPSLLETKEFDIILTDIQMPVIDGFEMLQNIRKLKHRIPVIALSGRKDLEEHYFLQKGFTAYHPKPIQFEKLLAVISGVFGDNMQGLDSEVSHKKNKKQGSLYDLQSLSQFTNNDPESLKMILNTLIISSKENCNDLIQAVSSRDEQQIINISHKMNPMLKQIEAYSISVILDELEDKKFSGNWTIIEQKVTDVCDKMANLMSLLKKEIA